MEECIIHQTKINTYCLARSIHLLRFSHNKIFVSKFIDLSSDVLVATIHTFQKYLYTLPKCTYSPIPTR